MYHYLESIKQDVRDWIKENKISLDACDLVDQLWAEDSVTGNGSGSYWCSKSEARKCITGDPLAEGYILDLVKEYGLDAETVAEHLFDWEYWDVSIRCWLLAQAVDEVLAGK